MRSDFERSQAKQTVRVDRHPGDRREDATGRQPHLLSDDRPSIRRSVRQTKAHVHKYIYCSLVMISASYPSFLCDNVYIFERNELPQDTKCKNVIRVFWTKIVYGDCNYNKIFPGKRMLENVGPVPSNNCVINRQNPFEEPSEGWSVKCDANSFKDKFYHLVPCQVDLRSYTHKW